MTAALLHSLFHVAAFCMLPPLFLGAINKTKALIAGRRGPALLQVYFDLFKLLRKDMVLSETTTGVFLAGPVVAVVTAIGAGLLTPVAGHGAPLVFAGDFVLFCYLLALGRFFTISAALDTGSPFEGMGAAREAAYSCLAEPALFVGLAALSHVSGSMTLSGIVEGTDIAPISVIALVAAAWFLVLLAENSRIPFDDPNTHLELTMIHEVMVLDHSGPAFGLVLYGAALKLFVMSALLSAVALPFGALHPLPGWAVFLCAMLAMAVIIGAVESGMARLRLNVAPKLLFCASLLSAFALVLLARA
ncbi:MAG: NADH-quinone oxidoreductase subunit H [Candidatus Hydrogenedentes bacterium]|nr:NADH-quinone oxidoreductase subunit H [Candidatus Hydrogenedentota bacterium]